MAHIPPGQVRMPARGFRNNATHTILAPNQDETLRTCSKVLHRHLLKRDSINPDVVPDDASLGSFDVDHFVMRSFAVVSPPAPLIAPLGFSMPYVQVHRPVRVPVANEASIFKLIKRLFDRGRLNVECAIIALIYIERFMECTSICLTAQNWIPIIAIALLTASKSWMDEPMWNVDLATILKVFSLRDINRLERQFLHACDYNFFIAQAEYANYYFNLRSLREAKAGNIPRYYLTPHDRMSRRSNRPALVYHSKPVAINKPSAAASTAAAAEDGRDSDMEVHTVPAPPLDGDTAQAHAHAHAHKGHAASESGDSDGHVKNGHTHRTHLQGTAGAPPRPKGAKAARGGKTARVAQQILNFGNNFSL